MKKKLYLTVVLAMTCLLAACGITQELEQAKATVAELKVSLKTQEEHYTAMGDNVLSIPVAFQADLAQKPETDLFKDENSAVYDVITQRQELTKSMAEVEQHIQTAQKELQRLVKKAGADVDNQQLSLIDHSLTIILSNFASLKVYLDTSKQQEEDFFTDLPLANISSQLSILKRTYGTIELVSEEAQANLEYTLALIDTFEAQAAANKERRK